MEVFISIAFCSKSHIKRKFKRTKWENQHGSGTDITLDFLWFSISLEIYNRIVEETSSKEMIYTSEDIR